MPLQKSFSEQHVPSKPRQHWHRSKTHAAPMRPNNDTRALEPISEATKNKLQAFGFQAPTESHEDVENVPPSMGATEQRLLTSMTPVNKLAWQDLVGAAQANDDPDDPSPNERIGWDTKQDPLYNISPVVPRKRPRKRARSSSPTSSPTSNATGQVQIGSLSQALQTPQPDPALDLWHRFSLSRSTLATPMANNIMASSSPQPAKLLSSHEAGLRRAISCGSQWPKRRRTERSEYLLTTEEGFPDDSKSSMVNALLNTVTGEIDSRGKFAPDREEHPDSPSRRETLRNMQKPLPKSRASSTESSLKLATQVSTPVATAFQGIEPVANQDQGGSSEYGDDDLDDQTWMELGAKVSSDCPASTVNPEGFESRQNADNPDLIAEEEFGPIDDELLIAAEVLASQRGPQEEKMNNSSGRHTSSNPGPIAVVDAAVPEQTDELYGDDIGSDFDFEAAELAATQSMKASTPLPHLDQKPRAVQRYLVTKVLQGDFINEGGQTSLEKILLVQVDGSELMKTIHLRDDWMETSVNTKAYVHVIGTFEPSGRCVVDNFHNMLILHPDQLISATVVADSFTCMRRAALQDRVKATSDVSPPLVYGTLLHEIFQAALMANRWTAEYLNSLVEDITQLHVEDLYRIKVPINEACEHLRSKMSELGYWASTFVSSEPKSEAVVIGRNGEKGNMCVSRLLDVEEHVWSPMYGLKGNIDATVQVTMVDNAERRTLTVPFEVKTGKNATSNHQAQTSLYNLLLSDRYDVEIAFGVLYYLETSQTIRIPTIRHEIRHMVMQRNRLAVHARERSVQLPSMKRSANTCGKCYAKVACFIYHKLANNGDGESSGMNQKFDEIVQHLTPAHRDFFLKWENLLTKEEKEGQKLRRELWTMTSSEREKVGRCFSHVIIEDGSASETAAGPKINRFQYTMVKENRSSGFSFLDSQLTVGDPIVVSDEQGHFALALGFVTAISRQRISIAVDRRLHNARIRRPGFHPTSNQVFASIMDVLPEGQKSSSSQGAFQETPERYRLDKDEFSNGMATIRNNLVQIMANDVFGSQQIRRLVVDLQPPRFKANSTQYNVRDYGSLNVDQRKAIEKVMSAMDYALVLGMPGTGKTTTIAHIIRALVGQGKSVLLTSYTHSAVDNILLKLKHDRIPILRLGAQAKVHPDVQDFANLACQSKNTFDEIHNAWHDTPIVATTCLGIGHPIFNERTFDYCIVDEASQITLPNCLGPIRMARTFVLVGDHNQLPPLVQNEDARAGGLDISLFKLLSDTHSESVVNLEHQYRMCEDVMLLSNTLIYEGRLKCGSEALRRRSLDVPNINALQRRHYDCNSVSLSTPRSICTGWASPGCWLRRLVDPEARVRFVNTDFLDFSREEAKGSRIVNTSEVEVVYQIIDALLTVGVPPDEIGVMTHYRSQLSLLKHSLRDCGKGIELHTADRFQGRDKEVVVLSLVRSNEACSIGDLLKDWRRINVAFTRAKTKLLVVGSKDTLKGCGEHEMLSKFVRLMEERDWIYDLPQDALESHFSREGATQVSTQRASDFDTSGATITRKATQHNCRDKENQLPAAPRGTITKKALFAGRPLLRDIMNDVMTGSH